MNLKIWETGVPARSGILYLRLFQEGEEVHLCVVDVEGHKMSRGTILAITAEGKLRRHTDLDPSFGFQLNERGQILWSHGS